MSPLPYPIPVPAERAHGRVGIRPVRGRDAAALRRLLAENRGWLQPWEATFPGGGGAAPGSQPLGPVIRAMHRQRKAGTGVTFVMLYDGQVVGQLSVSDISAGALRSASIGYWVSPVSYTHLDVYKRQNEKAIARSSARCMRQAISPRCTFCARGSPLGSVTRWVAHASMSGASRLLCCSATT